MVNKCVVAVAENRVKPLKAAVLLMLENKNEKKIPVNPCYVPWKNLLLLTPNSSEKVD